VGKTAFGLQAALAAASEDAPSYIFSMEMSDVQMRDRAIAHIARLPLSRVQALDVVGSELTRYTMALTRFKGVCRLNFKQSLSVGEICGAARTAYRVLGIKLVMVDYLGRIRQETKYGSTLSERIGVITSELKTLASELKTPVLLLAQLNRESEKDKREPQLSDLRDSGAIEQDADQVWGLHAPEGIEKPARTLIVLKGRNTGAGYRLGLNFLTDVQRLEERA
jgi:replicative DNA helicase